MQLTAALFFVGVSVHWWLNGPYWIGAGWLVAAAIYLHSALRGFRRRRT